MSEKDQRLKNWFIHSDPAEWPDELRRGSAPPLSRNGPAPRVDRSVEAAIARAQPAFLNARRIMIAAAALLLLALGSFVFLFTTGGETGAPAEPGVLAFVGRSTDASFPAGPFRRAGAFEVPAGTLLYLSFGSDTFVRFETGTFALEDPGTIRIRTGRVLLVSHGKASGLRFETPAGSYVRRGTTARLTVSGAGDLLEVLEGEFLARSGDRSQSAGPGDVLRTSGKGDWEKSALRAAQKQSLAASRASVQARVTAHTAQDDTPRVATPEERALTAGPFFRVTLKNGQVLEGPIVQHNGGSAMQTARGIVPLAGDDVGRVQRLR